MDKGNGRQYNATQLIDDYSNPSMQAVPLSLKATYLGKLLKHIV